MHLFFGSLGPWAPWACNRKNIYHVAGRCEKNHCKGSLEGCLGLASVSKYFQECFRLVSDCVYERRLLQGTTTTTTTAATTRRTNTTTRSTTTTTTLPYKYKYPEQPDIEINFIISAIFVSVIKCINNLIYMLSGWWFQTFLYFPFHIWDNRSH